MRHVCITFCLNSFREVFEIFSVSLHMAERTLRNIKGTDISTGLELIFESFKFSIFYIFSFLFFLYLNFFLILWFSNYYFLVSEPTDRLSWNIVSTNDTKPETRWTRVELISYVLVGTVGLQAHVAKRSSCVRVRVPVEF